MARMPPLRWLVTYLTRQNSILIIISISSVIARLEDHEALSYIEQEKRLIKKLFVDSQYNPLVRPVRHVDDVIQINFTLQLSQIIFINEKNQIMKSNVWMGMYWNDYQRVWDPREYGGISTLSVDAENIWVPEIVLLNNADGNYVASYKCKAVIYPDGGTMHVPPAIYQTSCDVDINHFPFDEQICTMEFMSWSFHGDEVNLTLKENFTIAIMDDYLPSGTWDVGDIPGRIVTYNETNGNSSILRIRAVFEFHIRRKTLFYVVNLIIPCVLISFVTPSVHVLPADGCEKITLSVSILITIVVFIFLVSKILPPFIVIPRIYKYLLFTIIMNVIAVFTSVIVINRNNRTPRTHGMPNWIRVVFLNHLPRYLRMKRPHHDTRWQNQDSPPASEVGKDNIASRMSKEFSRDTIASRMATEFSRDNIHSRMPAELTRDGMASRMSTEFSAFNHSNCELNSPVIPRREPIDEPNAIGMLQQGVIPDDMIDAVKSVKFIANHLELEEEYDTVVEDWKFVALVMDRLLFYVGFFITTVGTFGILIHVPTILDRNRNDTTYGTYPPART